MTGACANKAGGVRRVAVIDIGTVTVRLAVADVGPHSAVDVLRRHRIVQLGEGVATTHRLSAAALGRADAVLGEYCRILDKLAAEGAPAQKVSVLATSAARDAENVGELVRLLDAHGLSLSVIPGTLEAQLSFAGAVADFPGANLLVSDVGGGSTELAFGDAAPDSLPAVRCSQSIDIGARRITDLFLAAEPFATDQLARAQAWAHEQLAPFFSRLPQAPSRLIATAGTATTLVAIRDRLVPYDDARVHGATLTLSELDCLLECLAGMTRADRERVAGLEPKRAGVIVGGALVQREVLRCCGVDACTVSTRALLDGMLRESYNQLERPAAAPLS